MVNQKRLEYLEKTIKLINIANRMEEWLEANDAKNILKVIKKYLKVLNLLDHYDHKTIEKRKGETSHLQIQYKNCMNIIHQLRFFEKSTLFALERENGQKWLLEIFIKLIMGKTYIYLL